MKLLVIILSLLSERYLVHALSNRRFDWFSNYYEAVHQRIKSTNKILILLAVILPPLIISGILVFLFHHLLFGFIYFLLSLAIFYYCLGPENPFYPLRDEEEIADNDSAAGNYFVRVNGQLFALVFWFTLLGPLGALAYRLISLCRKENASSALAIKLTQLLDWIPARITVILFLLVGNFQRGVHFFSQQFLTGPEQNDKLLFEGGLLAARTTDTEPVQLPYAESLVEHAIIVYLVLLAIFTLAALL